MSEKIAYEKHPISDERVKELNTQGFKILDERFKPEDHKEPTKSTTKPKPEAKD